MRLSNFQGGGGVGLKVRQKYCAIKKKFLTLRGSMCVFPTTVYLCVCDVGIELHKQQERFFQPEGSDERWSTSSQKNEANKYVVPVVLLSLGQNVNLLLSKGVNLPLKSFIAYQGHKHSPLSESPRLVTYLCRESAASSLIPSCFPFPPYVPVCLRLSVSVCTFSAAS